MNRNEYLANRIREVLLDGKWIANTNYKDQLSGLSWQQATKNIGELNSIAKLTFHINYYLKGLLHFFEHGKLEIKDKYSFDLPQISSDHEWNNLVNELIKNSEEFAELVKRLPEEKLDDTFVEEKYGSYLRNIEGVIEHSYYHLGQISLLKKIITNNQVFI